VGVGSGVRLKTDVNPDGQDDVNTDTETVPSEPDTGVNTLLLRIIGTRVWYERLPACRKQRPSARGDEVDRRAAELRPEQNAAETDEVVSDVGAVAPRHPAGARPPTEPSHVVRSRPSTSAAATCHPQNGVCQPWRTPADLTASVNVSRISDSAAQRVMPLRP
jgi:hypothetical protein